MRSTEQWRELPDGYRISSWGGMKDPKGRTIKQGKPYNRPDYGIKNAYFKVGFTVQKRPKKKDKKVRCPYHPEQDCAC